MVRRIKMKYTFEELMKLSDKELEDLSRRVSKISSINYTINRMSVPRDKAEFKLRSWEVVDLMKYGSLASAIIFGCYFIGKGLSESKDESQK